jgi:hypothetical protein
MTGKEKQKSPISHLNVKIGGNKEIFYKGLTGILKIRKLQNINYILLS